MIKRLDDWGMIEHPDDLKEEHIEVKPISGTYISRNIADTSMEAYRDMMQHPYEVSGRQMEYLESLKEIGHPATDQEVSKYAGHKDPNYFRPRRYELAGLDTRFPEFTKTPMVKMVGKRKCKITGRTAKIWMLTDEANHVVEG